MPWPPQYFTPSDAPANGYQDMITSHYKPLHPSYPLRIVVILLPKEASRVLVIFIGQYRETLVVYAYIYSHTAF